eukprot:1346705-Lingulodinium_polyedra.AAC.1
MEIVQGVPFAHPQPLVLAHSERAQHGQIGHLHLLHGGVLRDRIDELTKGDPPILLLILGHTETA